MACLDVLERDMAGLKVDVRELRREMNERFNRSYREMNERLDQMGERMDRTEHQMVVQTRWLIGALTGIGMVISLVLAIDQFVR